MNLKRFYEILAETTILLHKGPELVKSLGNYTDDFSLVDCHFFVVCVDKRLSEAYRALFLEFLDAYPKPERLNSGPSYIEVASVLGSEETALQFFALGQALGLWQVITPVTMGVAPGPVADRLAEKFLMITGYKKPTAELVN
jgi:hypothetical protein